MKRLRNRGAAVLHVVVARCFGMPTAMVADRERGVWRRFRLLPAATGSLVKSASTNRTWDASMPSRSSRSSLSRWVAGWSTSNQRTPGLAYRNARPS